MTTTSRLEKKLAQLPAGWKIDGEGFRLECEDGMHCKIFRCDGGWICGRYWPAEKGAQSAMFCKTWKEVVETAHA
jgi:hypothetical protein